ncbi:MAG: hypothetical protein ABIQ31_17900 [Ferruginibacter sp.]
MFLKKLFARKAGGSFFGNLIRTTLNAETGGLLENFINKYL